MRAPLLPLEALRRYDYWRHTENVNEAAPSFRPREDAPFAMTPESLTSLESEAIYLASPSLHERASVIELNAEQSTAHSLALTLQKYRVRMGSRATPFGLFAACSLGTIGIDSSLKDCYSDQLRRRTRLDHAALVEIANTLLLDNEVGPLIKLRPNTSVTRVADSLHVTKRERAGRRYQYHLIVVDDSDALQEALSLAGRGASRIECVRHFVAQGYNPSEAESFVDELIEQQVLVSELEPSVCTFDGLGTLRLKVQERAPKSKVCIALGEMHQMLLQFDASVGVRPPATYEVLAERVRDLAKRDLGSGVFQVDSFRSASLTLSDRLAEAILDGAALLRRLSVSENVLEAFRDAFRLRYEQREVPLLEALDPEVGLDFSSIGAGGSHSSQRRARTLSERDAVLHRLILDAKVSATNVVDLNEAAIEALAATSHPSAFPPSFIINVSLLGAASVNDSEWKIVWNGGGGASAASMIGRFCDLDGELHSSVRDLLAEEERANPTCIEAEIVHLPQDRIGNVMTRPSLREFEIEYLGRSEAPRDRVLTPDDLVLYVRDGRLRLRSRRLNREVLPRLSCAHNFMHETNLPVYQLLCLLQRQGVQSTLRWDWGAFASSSWLPRVQHGQLVLARARWIVRHEEVIGSGAYASSNLVELVRLWRTTQNIPRFVNIVDGDLELLCDLESKAGVHLFITELRSSSVLTLMEWLAEGPTDVPLTGDGHYASEIVLPVLFSGEAASPASFVSHDIPGSRAPSRRSTEEQSGSGVARRLPPGGDWLYLKLYCGAGRFERVLESFEQRVIRSLNETGALSCWFFLRYADPDSHLRIRLARSERASAADLFAAASQWSLERVKNGDPLRVQIDTYEREIERYGGPEAMLLAEQLFCVDSEFIVKFVRAQSIGRGGEYPALAGVLTIDTMLDAFAMTVDDRRDLLAPVGMSHNQRRTLEGKHRAYRTVVSRSLTNRNCETRKNVQAALGEFRTQLIPIASQLRQLLHQSRISVSWASLLRSFIHMHINRLYATEHSTVEQEVCFLLWREYATRIWRREANSEVEGPT
ncbi:MAG: lantibiotic dehydratase [Gemmatimonadaceae bacterium]|nr:lantibiotic dehydratase [Gemmatimonadaceae bacterium]